LSALIANPDVQVLVAEVEQEIVGLSCLNPTDRPGYLHHSTPIELCRFYLHLDWIGCGIGSKLMAETLRRAAVTGYDICWLRVWQVNKGAINFYRQWGFTTISADDYATDNTMLPVWVMIHAFSQKRKM
jgi:GNAT superfamily N-acetyltransferase